MEQCLTIENNSMTYHFDKCIQCIQEGRETELSETVMNSLDNLQQYDNINVIWYMNELKLTDVQYILFICRLCVEMQQKFPRSNKTTTIHVHNLTLLTRYIFDTIQKVIVLPNIKFVVY